MRPVCVACRVQMRCEKNQESASITVDEMPYQIWQGDRYQCPRCAAQIIVGWGHVPVWERHAGDPEAATRRHHPLKLRE